MDVGMEIGIDFRRYYQVSPDEVCAAEFFLLASGIHHFFNIERDADGKPVRMGSAVGDFYLNLKTRVAKVSQQLKRPSEVPAGSDQLRGEAYSTENITKRATDMDTKTHYGEAMNRLSNPETWDTPASNAVLKMRFSDQAKAGWLSFETAED